jgi:Chaperone of endosialidase
MPVPYTFASATAAIPLSNLDSNFATAVTIGNTAVQLGNTITNLTGVTNVASGSSLTLQTNGSTTAVTIDTAQNVGIGVTSPSAKLQVNAPNFALATSYSTLTSNFAVRTTDSAAANVGGEIALGGYNNGTSSVSDFVRLHGKKENGTAGNDSGYFAVEVGYDGASPYIFERMRIDSSGNLNVGQTSGGLQNSNSFSLGIDGNGFRVSHVNGTSSGAVYCNFGYNGSSIGSITQSGTTAVNFNGNSVPPSDQRLKENIVDAPSAQTFINNIKVRSFDWIADKTHQTYGMIAQELMTVAPEVVPIPPDENTMMGIDYAKLVPALVKCVQELSAQVTSLQATVTALQAKVGA